MALEEVNDAEISMDSIRAAQVRTRGHVVKTSLLESRDLNFRAQGRVFVKAECQQHTGSFKFRGAINRLFGLSEHELARGVVAFSSGNHALAVAEAARVVGCKAVVVMPKDAPGVKIRGARARGATVVLYDREVDDREAIVREFIETNGMVFVSPFDDPHVIAGQGTGAAEAAQQLIGDFNVTRLDQALVCCSGGGLASGWAIALGSVFPESELITVEPEGFDDMARSLSTRRRETNTVKAGSICDALQVNCPGQLTLPVLLAWNARGVTVSDQDVREAIKFAATELKLVLEPGGAAALAAVLSGRIETKDRVTLLVASGGNIDASLLAEVLK